MKKNIILSILCITLILTIFVGCSNDSNEKTEVTLLLDWTPNTNHTGLYVAKENGYFAEAGLDVEIIQPSDGNVAQTVASGQAEFGISYQEELTYARANQVPIVSIATIIQHNTSGFAAPESKNITSPKDFAGKKYGGWGSPVEIAIIDTIMKKENMDSNTVEVVNTGAADFFTVTERDVDFQWIYYGWTGVEAGLRDYPINFIELRKVAPELDYYTPIVITSEALISENPDLVEKFMEAVTKGYEFAIEKPEEAANILLDSVSGLDQELVQESQNWLSPKYQEDAEQWGEQKEEIWQNYTKWMTENELIDSEIIIEEAYTNDFLPKR